MNDSREAVVQSVLPLGHRLVLLLDENCVGRLANYYFGFALFFIPFGLVMAFLATEPREALFVGSALVVASLSILFVFMADHSLRLLARRAIRRFLESEDVTADAVIDCLPSRLMCYEDLARQVTTVLIPGLVRGGHFEALARLLEAHPQLRVDDVSALMPMLRSLDDVSALTPLLRYQGYCRDVLELKARVARHTLSPGDAYQVMAHDAARLGDSDLGAAVRDFLAYYGCLREWYIWEAITSDPGAKKTRSSAHPWDQRVDELDFEEIRAQQRALAGGSVPPVRPDSILHSAYPRVTAGIRA